MALENFGAKVGFIWSVADLLRGPYRPNQYKDVMLPLTVLRQLDCVLEFNGDRLERVTETRFREEGINERADLQRILREQVEIVSPDTLVIAEEFGEWEEWEESRRRIDLLGLDKQANLVVVASMCWTGWPGMTS